MTEEYYVFWKEEYPHFFDIGYDTEYYCTSIELAPHEISSYGELLENGGKHCRIDYNAFLPTPEYTDEFVIQKRKATYSAVEKIRLGRLLDCHKDRIGNYQTNSTAVYLESLADEIRRLRNDSSVGWGGANQEVITDEAFYTVLLEGTRTPITLLDGYDPKTGRVLGKLYPPKNKIQLSPESKTRLSIAKKIVYATLPLTQNDTTRTNYCNYLLWLLWMRENWLLPDRTATWSIGLDENRQHVESWGTEKAYTDIQVKKLTPLFCNALTLFCGIDVTLDFPQKVIDLLLERNHIRYTTADWPSGPTKFCKLTPVGKQIAEYSEPRLCQLIGLPVRASTKSAYQDFENTPIAATENKPPMVYSAASGKGNRQVAPLEISENASPVLKTETALVEWADEPGAVYLQNDEGKVIEDAVYRGTLRANFVSQNLEEKERNILLHETLGVTATEIVNRNGTPKTNVESEKERVKKQLQRSKPK